VYAYFTYAATASKITDDVTMLVMHIPTYSTLVLLLRTVLTKKCILFDEFE